ncbi:MAG: DUF4160 domain-containing protein [Bacteroidia bacterium]|nr:DUF4160 domain-containing protein [Bacteroidia bacterium]
MGKLLILSKFIFLIYSSDIYEKRKHIHVTYARRGHKKACKYWLEPKIELDESKKGDFTEVELNEIEKLLYEHKKVILKQLELFYNIKQVKAIRL